MKKIVFLLFACVALFACKDEESGPGYVVPVVREAADFTDIDGKVYKCIEIGDQIWMAENLARRLPLGCRDGVFTYNEEVLDSVNYSQTPAISSDAFKAAFWAEMEAAHTDGRISDEDWAIIDALSRTMSVSSILMNLRFDLTAAGFAVVNTECYPAASRRLIDEEAIIEGQEHFEEAELANGHYSETYGLLYTYEAALRAIPEGWRLPTDEDWNKLEAALGMSASEIAKTNEWRGNREAALLKEGAEGIGFDVRLGGARGLTYLQSNDHINYINYGQNAYFWCSDRIQADTVGITRNIAVYTDKIMKMTTLFSTERGKRFPVLYSVRCVKDKN